MSNTNPSADHALAYPEPPASPLWHRHGPRPRRLTPEQQRRPQQNTTAA